MKIVTQVSYVLYIQILPAVIVLLAKQAMSTVNDVIANMLKMPLN